MSPKKKQTTPRKATRDPNNPWGLKTKSPICKPIAKPPQSPIKGRNLFSILEKNKGRSWLEMMDSDDSNDTTKYGASTVTNTETIEQMDNGDLLITENSVEIKVEQKHTLIEADSAKKTRKSAAPKKTDPTPKFEKSLNQLTGLLLNRRSDRIRAKQTVRDIGLESQIESLRQEAAEEGVVLPEIDYKATYNSDHLVIRELESGELPDSPVNRKRRLSTSSTATSPGRGIPKKSARMYTPTREVSSRMSVSKSRTSSRADSLHSTPIRTRIDSVMNVESPNPREGWETPKQGWCYDEAALARRTREIEKAKEKDVYLKYIAEVARHERKRGSHPRTPNKFIDYSRRSWDAQMRAWKRSIYDWAGMSPSASVINSINGSIADLDDLEERDKEDCENETPSKLLNKAIEKMGEQPVYNPDQMASLMGHFDLQTRGESTLKAPTVDGCKGPVDFSQLAN